MVWLTLALLVYCVVCWVAAWLVVPAPHPKGQNDARKYLARLRLALILLAPLFMPFVVFRMLPCLGQVLRSRRRVDTLRRINRTVREYEFAPVDACCLGETVHGHFESLTPPLVELGFRPLGDFRMKPEPVVVHNRLLLSADGRTLASVCCLLERGAVSLISVLEDGTSVHTAGTANPDPERTFEPEDRLWLTYVPCAGPGELYREHEEVVRTASERRGVRALEFRPDQFREVMVYDQRLFNRWRFRYGGLDHEPPAPDFNTLVAVEDAAAPQGRQGCMRATTTLMR
jgi:hypothetical protein